MINVFNTFNLSSQTWFDTFLSIQKSLVFSLIFEAENEEQKQKQEKTQ